MWVELRTIKAIWYLVRIEWSGHGYNLSWYDGEHKLQGGYVRGDHVVSIREIKR